MTAPLAVAGLEPPDKGQTYRPPASAERGNINDRATAPTS
jgi:hypothetical protein